jgi:uncharacterized membrane protein YqjE
LGPSGSGIFSSLRAVLASLPDIAATRLQLAGVELEQQRLHLAQMFLLAICSLFLTGVGLVLLAMLLVLVFWDGPRVLVLGVLTALFLLSGAALAWRWRQARQHRPAFLADTLQELKNDRDALLGTRANTP